VEVAEDSKAAGLETSNDNRLSKHPSMLDARSSERTTIILRQVGVILNHSLKAPAIRRPAKTIVIEPSQIGELLVGQEFR
jgi:hypothetical protein